MIAFPTTMRALNLCRTSQGWQASLQTDAHAFNAFSIAIASTPEAAIAEVCVPHVTIPDNILPPFLKG